MKTLIWVITQAWNWLQWLITEIWRLTVRFVSSFWGAFIIAVGWVYAVVHWVADHLGRLIMSEISSVFDGFNLLPSGTLAHWFAVCNYVLPLEELITMTVLYVVLLVVLTIYRYVKSFIPTLSGS